MAQANLVQNGSFETGYEATTQINGGWPGNHGFWAPIGYNGATDTIPNWTVSGGGVDWQDADPSVPGSMVAADGARFVDLNSCCSNPPGVISQTIATIPGVSYTLSFSYSGHSYWGCYFGPKTMQANAGSTSTVVSADPAAEGYLDGTNIWHAASVSFTASGSSTVISFESLENDGTCAGPLVDNVRVTADNLVQNGSFETGYEATTQINGGWPGNHGFWAPIEYNGATDTIPNWTVSGGGVDWHDTDSTIPSSMAAADGARMVDLNGGWGSTPGMISQAIATTPGVSYTLSFSYSGHPYSGCYFGPKTMQANAGSTSTVVSADPAAEGYLDGTNLWHAASVSFTASSSSTVISFQSLENDGTCAGPLVDNVWVLPQPPSAQPQPVLDQSQTVGGWSAGGLDQWQSFTAGKTGLLTQLDLNVGSGLLNESQDGVLRIYSGEGTDGPLLATQEVTFQYKLNEFQSFQFLTPALVQAGSLYTYRFSIPRVNVGWVYLNLNNPYPNGRASHDPGADYLFRTYVTPLATGIP
ncbi:MAG TPA: DUF642 domain-containing protein [Thermoanaerobaculia bacterium]